MSYFPRSQLLTLNFINHRSIYIMWTLQEIEPRVAEELCRLFPKDEGINLTPVLHKSKRASRVARARGPLRRPLQSPGDRRGRPRERGSFRGRGDVGFRCVTATRVESRKGEACILLKLPLVPTAVELQHTPLLKQEIVFFCIFSVLYSCNLCLCCKILLLNMNRFLTKVKQLRHTNCVNQTSTQELLTNPSWGCFAEVHFKRGSICNSGSEQIRSVSTSRSAVMRTPSVLWQWNATDTTGMRVIVWDSGSAPTYSLSVLLPLCL